MPVIRPPRATPNLNLPIPGDASPADFVTDVGALADRIDVAVVRPMLVSSLPASPADGQEAYYLADASAGVVWHLRHRAAAPAPYRWEFLGGPPWIAEAATPEAISSTAWTDFSAGPSIQLPSDIGGDFICELAGVIFNGAQAPNFGGFMAVTVGGTAVATVHRSFYSDTPRDMFGPMSRQTKLTNVPTGSLVKTQGRGDGVAPIEIRDRSLSLLPVRLG